MLWDGIYGFSSWSEKTRKSIRLHMLYKGSIFFSVILNPPPTAQQTSALPTELNNVFKQYLNAETIQIL